MWRIETFGYIGGAKIYIAYWLGAMAECAPRICRCSTYSSACWPMTYLPHADDTSSASDRGLLWQLIGLHVLPCAPSICSYTLSASIQCNKLLMNPSKTESFPLSTNQKLHKFNLIISVHKRVTYRRSCVIDGPH